MHLIDYLPQLPPPVARYALYTLTKALPPPDTDLPEERAARDVAAVAAVAALRPADALEARLAAQAVAADAHVIDCLRLAGVVGRRCEETAQRCRAQAATMGRLQHSALRALRLLQNGRGRAHESPAVEDVQPTRHDAPIADAPPPAPDIVAEAEHYVAVHRERAAVIRARGGDPARLHFPLPRPEVMRAIVTGNSPLLRSLDKKRRPPLAAAA
ncbi:MAG TPA: hypothetical protein VKI44_27045 [Acetobacteraceae bacterium]|nr:hypothetical protein [Acetobacteraceae bacterium]